MVSVETLRQAKAIGVVLSGGPASAYDAGSPHVAPGFSGSFWEWGRGERCPGQQVGAVPGHDVGLHPLLALRVVGDGVEAEILFFLGFRVVDLRSSWSRWRA